MAGIIEEILLSLNLKARFIPDLKDWVFSRPRIKRGVLVAIARALVENHCKKGDRLFVVYDGRAVRVIF